MIKASVVLVEPLFFWTQKRWIRCSYQGEHIWSRRPRITRQSWRNDFYFIYLTTHISVVPVVKRLSHIISGFVIVLHLSRIDIDKMIDPTYFYSFFKSQWLYKYIKVCVRVCDVHMCIIIQVSEWIEAFLAESVVDW